MESLATSIVLATVFSEGLAEATVAFNKNSYKMVPARIPEDFTSSVFSLSLEAPYGIQLLSVSVLLLVFAVAITEGTSSDECCDEIKADKSHVNLLRADVIAFRSGIITCLVGLAEILPASPRPGLNPMSATVEASEGIQLLSLSVLLLVFAVAVSSANVEQNTESKSQVYLVKANAIAFRSGILAGLLGLASMRAEFKSFSPAMTTVEAPEGVQLLTVSVLLLVFALAILESKEEEEKKSQIELVSVERIAFRSGIMAGLVGLAQVGSALQAAVVQALEQGQEGHLLLTSSAFLLIIVIVMRNVFNFREIEEMQFEELKLKGRTYAQLVRPEAIALRAAVLAGLTGLLKTTSSTGIPGLDISGEIAVVILCAGALAKCQWSF